MALLHCFCYYQHCQLQLAICVSSITAPLVLALMLLGHSGHLTAAAASVTTAPSSHSFMLPAQLF
jgi:ABC-type transport system involved in cytochrome bd biosynthesis fused ATPase/permease subunit